MVHFLGYLFQWFVATTVESFPCFVWMWVYFRRPYERMVTFALAFPPLVVAGTMLFNAVRSVFYN